MRHALVFIAENARTLLFVGGFVAFYVGMSGYSRPAANVAAGALVMAIAAAPYLARFVKKG